MNRYKCIEFEERKIIEEMYNTGAKPCEIAKRIGKCQATIYREIKRGETEELNERCRPAYRAEIAEMRGILQPRGNCAGGEILNVKGAYFWGLSSESLQQHL